MSMHGQTKGQAMERRKISLAVAAAALLVAGAIARPHANLELQLHDVADHAPNRAQAALDVGVVAISVLVTWTGGQTRY